MMTYDHAHASIDAGGNSQGARFDRPMRTHDGRTVDSTGAFLVGELERLDLTMNEPLVDVSFGRDIDMREDVTIADEVSSFTLSQYASAGGAGTGNGIGNGKAWIGKSSDQVTGVSVDIAKVPHPLTLWGAEIKYSIPELESAARLGRPIDQQIYDGLQLKHQMDIDEQVYIGDVPSNATGIINNSLVTPTNLPAGAGGSPLWSQKTPQEILNDFNFMLTTVWTASAFALMPERVLLPTDRYGYIATQIVSQAGNESILKYILENNLRASSGMSKLQIFPSKWCNGAGAGGTIGNTSTTCRAVVYTKNKKRVRFPMTLLQRTPIQFDSIYHKTTYYCRLGQVELVYPESLGQFDGL